MVLLLIFVENTQVKYPFFHNHGSVKNYPKMKGNQYWRDMEAPIFHFHDDGRKLPTNQALVTWGAALEMSQELCCSGGAKGAVEAILRTTSQCHLAWCFQKKQPPKWYLALQAKKSYRHDFAHTWCSAVFCLWTVAGAMFASFWHLWNI